MNLISNAVKNTYEGGVTIYLEYLNEKLTLKVEDTGIGIEYKDQ